MLLLDARCDGFEEESEDAEPEVLVLLEAAQTAIVRVLLGRKVVCCFKGETQVELGMMVGQDPEELEEVGAALTKGVGHHGCNSKSLSKIMKIILPPLGGFHNLEGSVFEVMLQVEGVANGDVHDEFGVSREPESVGRRDDIAQQGHHVGTLAGWG
jgi:hypothetical protein